MTNLAGNLTQELQKMRTSHMCSGINMPDEERKRTPSEGFMPVWQVHGRQVDWRQN